MTKTSMRGPNTRASGRLQQAPILRGRWSHKPKVNKVGPPNSGTLQTGPGPCPSPQIQQGCGQYPARETV
jgi:hypothetical protein